MTDVYVSDMVVVLSIAKPDWFIFYSEYMYQCREEKINRDLGQ